MFRSNRGIFIAIGLIAALAAAIGAGTWPVIPELASYGEAKPTNSHYHAGGDECESTSLAAVRNGRERLHQADACTKEAEAYRQQTNDLIQQTRAADAANAQAQIASQQLWTGWLQTLGGFLTLVAAVGAAYYAKEAARHGDTAAKASNDAVAQTRDRLEMALHGWSDVIQALDVDRREPWSDVRHRQEDQAISV